MKNAPVIIIGAHERSVIHFFMTKAKKLPSGRWRVNQYVGKDADGKRKFKSITADTKKEAEYLAAQFVLVNGLDHKDRTLGHYVDEYITARQSVLSPTTIQGYKKIRRTMFQQLQELQIDRIDNITLQRAINEESAKYSPKTVSNAYHLISSVLKQNTYTRFSVSLPKLQKKVKQLPEPIDIMRIIKGTDIELPCLLAMWMSFRMSEVQGFKKSDIKNGVITVNRVIVYVDREYIVKDYAKTPSSRRSLPVPAYIMSLISAVPDEQEYLVALSGQAIYKRFSRLLDDNNMEHITFHDLRHMNASIMLALGVPDKYAMERGGWETDSVLKSVYQNTFTAERQKVDSMIDGYFSDLIARVERVEKRVE